MQFYCWKHFFRLKPQTMHHKCLYSVVFMIQLGFHSSRSISFGSREMNGELLKAAFVSRYL